MFFMPLICCGRVFLVRKMILKEYHREEFRKLGVKVDVIDCSSGVMVVFQW